MLSKVASSLNSATFRGKFLIAPVITLATMVLVSALFLWKMNEQREGAIEIKENDLVIIGQLSGVSARISHIHARVYRILQAAKAGADEEAVYELGKPLIEHLVGIEELLINRLLMAQTEYRRGDLYEPIRNNFIKYKSTIISAIEISTVDALMAEEQLLEASAIFNHLVIDLQEGLKHIGADINNDITRNLKTLSQTISLMIVVFVTAVFGAFVSSLYLSGSLTRDIGSLIGVMDKLSHGKKDIEIPTVSSSKELTALAGGLRVFQKSLEKIDEQRWVLEENNQLLRLEIEQREMTETSLEETRAHFQYTLDHNPTIIYTANSSGSILDVTFVSENAKKVIGYDASELLGDKRKWLARLEIEDGRFLNKQMSELYKKGSLVRDYRIKNHAGDYVWVQDSLTLSYGDEGPAQVLGSLTNITEIKAAEEKLQRMNAELFELASSLEEKVKNRTMDLEQANKELERLSEAKSEFVSIVSHDLRTPLTSIKLFSDIMLDDLENIDKTSQEEYLSIISAETDRLSRLISNVLDFQKISAGKMQWNDSYVDIVDVIRDCVKPFRISVESKGLEFICEYDQDELKTVIDGDRLAQVVYNLLSNSLKFTEDGFIKVSLKRLNTVAGESFRLSVSDSGPGMAEDQLENIFQPFEQIQGSTNMGKGTGLGLYITSCVVDRYHGQAWAESVLGEGATFNIEMPIRHPDSLVI